nr:MAG TPA: hypothetical protein [Caudoviricetes sp.]
MNRGRIWITMEHFDINVHLLSLQCTVFQYTINGPNVP